MLDYKTSPLRVTRHSRSAKVREWLTKQQELEAHFVLIAIETDRLMIHAAIEGDWLASLDWSGKQIIVTEADDVGSPYEFRGFKSAFTFLDAFLLHHFIKTSEARVKSATLVPLTALAG